jgi:hypothetical protein
MGLRQALNVCYALLVDRLDGDQRKAFEDTLHGWDAVRERANKALWEGRIEGEAATNDGRASAL